MTCLIIICSYCSFIKSCISCEYLSASFICVPSYKYVSSSCTCRNTDSFIIIYTEVHRLRSRTPVKSWICTCIWMKEYTVLNLAPLSVYYDTILRHLAKLIFFCTFVINIPSFEGISITCNTRNVIFI